MSEARDNKPDALSWTVFKLGEQPAKGAVAGFFLVCFIAFTLYVFGILLALVALLVFATALNTWYLPVTYTLDRTGVTINKRVFSYTYPWEQFRRWFSTSNGVVLSPFSRKTFLDTFRGVHLLLPPDPKPVIEYLLRRFERRPELADRSAELSLDTRDSTDMMDSKEPDNEN